MIVTGVVDGRVLYECLKDREVIIILYLNIISIIVLIIIK